MAQAYQAVQQLGVGIQLTPGNLPTPGFEREVAASGVATRTHHGFSFEQRVVSVWSAAGACLVPSHSVHPPEQGQAPDWRRWYAAASDPPVLEVMVPGYALGSGREVEQAMADEWPLAVDVSHVFIQLRQGVMTEAVWQRLCRYRHIREIHVSANAGRADSHQPLTAHSFGLGWARERVHELPVVLECYMHRMSVSERQEQLELLGAG